MASQTEYELIFRNAEDRRRQRGAGRRRRRGGPRWVDRRRWGPRAAGRAAEEVDGRDLVLAPGFIDPHTHLDANLFWDPDLTPSSSFGVTTVVTANCGYALAPVLDEERARLPGGRHEHRRADPRGVHRDRRAVRLVRPAVVRGAARPLDVLLNHAFLIGHVPLRAAVLGVPGAYSRPATADEIEAMGRLLAPGARAGRPRLLHRPGGRQSRPRRHGPARAGVRRGRAAGPGRRARARARAGPVHHGQRRPAPGPGRAGGRPGLAPAAGRRPRGARWWSGRSSTRTDDPGGAAPSWI